MNFWKRKIKINLIFDGIHRQILLDSQIQLVNCIIQPAWINFSSLNLLMPFFQPLLRSPLVSHHHQQSLVVQFKTKIQTHAKMVLVYYFRQLQLLPNFEALLPVVAYHRLLIAILTCSRSNRALLNVQSVLITFQAPVAML